jgi:major membrane immunogen (membrane-anchored lipoprotein)
MTRHVFTLCVALCAAIALSAVPPASAATLTKCEMSFTLKGWSAFYKTAKGSGTIQCENGQKAVVTIKAKGGGLTAGKSEVRDGHGKFSDVGDIAELFGTYVQAQASAGAVKSAEASAMTKGEVSLALTGKGSGFELGVSFGKFVITKR